MLCGFIWFLFAACFFYFVGKLFGGKGSYKDLFTSVFWACTPHLIGMFLFEMAGLFAFIYSNYAVGSNSLIFVFRILASAMSIWGKVISVIILSEIQQFSIIRSTTVFVIFLISMVCLGMFLGHSALEAFGELIRY